MSRADWTRLAQALLGGASFFSVGAAAAGFSPKACLVAGAFAAVLSQWVHEAGIQTPPTKG
jgi:hypothetical protein